MTIEPQMVVPSAARAPVIWNLRTKWSPSSQLVADVINVGPHTRPESCPSENDSSASSGSSTPLPVQRPEGNESVA